MSNLVNPLYGAKICGLRATKKQRKAFQLREAQGNVTVPELILLLVAAGMFYSSAIPRARERVASARVYNRPAGRPARKEKPRRNITRRAQYPRRVSRCTRIRLARMVAAHRIVARESMPFLYVKRKGRKGSCRYIRRHYSETTGVYVEISISALRIARTYRLKYDKVWI